MQTLQQHQSKKPLVRCLVGSMVRGCWTETYGYQGSNGVRQTPGGVWTAGTRETKLYLCLMHRLCCLAHGGATLQGIKGWMAPESQFR